MLGLPRAAREGIGVSLATVPHGRPQTKSNGVAHTLGNSAHLRAWSVTDTVVVQSLYGSTPLFELCTGESRCHPLPPQCLCAGGAKRAHVTGHMHVFPLPTLSDVQYKLYLSALSICRSCRTSSFCYFHRHSLLNPPLLLAVSTITPSPEPLVRGTNLTAFPMAA